MNTRLRRGDVFIVLCKCFFGQIHPLVDLGRGQKGQRCPLLHKTFYSDRKATATNRVHSNNIEACAKECSYFWFRSEVKFLTHFDDFLILSDFASFNAISIDVYL